MEKECLVCFECKSVCLANVCFLEAKVGFVNVTTHNDKRAGSGRVSGKERASNYFPDPMSPGCNQEGMKTT